MKANESKHISMTADEAREDRKLFVHNLGELLAQTREEIVGAELDDEEIVRVRYESGSEKCICVEMDSFMAIIRDVTKHL